MEQFRKYIGKKINLENVKNSQQLNIFEISCDTFLEPLEGFDEIEFSTNFYNQDIFIGVAVQTGEIKRIMFAIKDPEDPEIIKGLTETNIKELLKQKGEQLTNFFTYITQ